MMKMKMKKIIGLIMCFVVYVGRVVGHGALYIPTPRNSDDRFLPEFENGKSPLEACTCNNGNGSPLEGCDLGFRGNGNNADGQACLWWSQGCSIGCDECATETYGTNPINGQPPQAGKIGFRTRYCNSTLEPTLPRHAWTLNLDAVEGSVEDSYRYNPWRAPGHAPVVDPCGQAGGEYGYQRLGGDSVYYNTSFAGMGMLGSQLPPSKNKTHWKTGTNVTVAWGPRYNHGGGYQYRLCPANETLSEECFQRMPLEFDRTAQVLVWNNGSLTYSMKSQAVFVDTGVKPIGSTWARNPIPRVNDNNLGLAHPETCPGPGGDSGPGCLQFRPPCPWDHGLIPCHEPHENEPHTGSSQEPLGRCDHNGMGACSSDWVVGTIQDKVVIPKNLSPGDYVLGWRWDCEETAQIWQNCADVVIT